MTIEDACKVFSWGVDYGLLLAEQERDSEDLFDAFGCMVYAQKYNVPSSVAPRRKPHSGAWRRAKSDAVMDFIAFCRSAEETTTDREPTID